MSIGIFSDFQNSITMANNTTFKANNSHVEEKKVEEKQPVVVEKNKPSKKEKVVNTIKTVAPIAIPLVTIPLTALVTYKITNKNTNALKEQISGLSNELSNLKAQHEKQISSMAKEIASQAEVSTKSDAQLWSVVLAVAGLGGSFKAGKMSTSDKKEATIAAARRIENINNTANNANTVAGQALSATGNGLNTKYTLKYADIPLLNVTGTLNRNSNKYDSAIESIKTEAKKRLFEAPNVKPIEKENPALWSITSEFAPVKEGGLGSVPVELQNNITKLGVETPAFIPMYQEKGISSFREEDGKYIYRYKNNEFKLEKAASFKIDTYRGNKASSEEIEVYVHNGQDEQGRKKQLIFIKNDNYFDGTIYQPGIKTEEPEKFAVFSKAVYELAKAKFDLYSVKDLAINTEVFNTIPAPDALIVNDWQASPVAALARYKAPMENAFGRITDDAAEKLKDMRIITIGHNAMYQGSTQCNNDDVQRKEATANVLNTLFDDFAYDITKNAKTGASESNPADIGLKNLDNVIMMNENQGWSSHTNFLNMGICLSDYFCPVSENYAKELISPEHPELSGELQWALTQKTKAGAVKGIINGSDYKNLNIEAKHSNIKNTTGVDFETYNKNNSIADIMTARKNNKINLYNNFMIPFTMKNDSENNSDDVNSIRRITTKLELYEGKRGTSLPKLSNEEIVNTPIITSLGRLVSQKGINVMTEAVKILMDNWEKDFPGKQKPIFYFAGQDGENGAQRKYIEELKDSKLSKEDADRVVFAHGFAPMAAITAGSDFFLLPSIFEPCGLTQGESFALATPVIGSAVGGIVDTVNRNGKTNGVLTEKDKSLTPERFYEAMKKGLQIYFDEPEKYQAMVQDSLNEDFSWIQPGKKGPIYDYLDLVGISRKKLPDAV